MIDPEEREIWLGCAVIFAAIIIGVLIFGGLYAWLS